MRYLVILVLLFISISCEDLLEVPDISSQRVSLLAPKDSTRVRTLNVLLSWEEVVEAETYKVQLATPDFEDANQLILDKLIVVDSTYTGPQLQINLQNQSYQWRVKAMNSAYETEYTTAFFTVDTTSQN